MMFPDGSMSREYEFSAGPLDDAYTLWVEEHIDITRTHIALVELRLNGMLLLKVRIGVRADGVLVLGPKEYSRAAGYAGDWLPPLFTYEDLVVILLTPS